MKTIKEFTTEFMGYGLITVPAGTLVTNETACGIDKNYNFVNEFGWVKTNYPEIASILLHDLTYHGLNIPAEYVSVNKMPKNDDNELLQKSEKLTSAIRDFFEAKEYEKCDFCISPQPGRDNWFFLIDIHTGKIVSDGIPSRLKSYLSLRGISPERVYKYSYIDNKFIKVINQ